ncbi:MAG: ATP-binding protein [Gammaproteobacteria bacterium]|nr:ATP-binding protein [Gammaproteobacteria bacterium]
MNSLSDLQARVRLEQVRQVIQQAPAAMIGMPATAAMAGVIIWGVIPNALVISWLFAVACIVGTRGLLMHRFHRSNPGVSSGVRWTRYYIWLEIASGLVWAALSLMLYLLPIEKQLFVIIIYAGMSAGAFGMLAPIYKTVVAYLIPYSIATIFSLIVIAVYMSGDIVHSITAAAVALYTVVLLRTAWVTSCALRESYALRFENIGLLDDVRKTAASLAAESIERRDVESRLRMSQKEYQNVLENMEDTYYRTGVNGAIVYTSPSVFRMLGYQREELVGVNMGSLYTSDNSRDQFLSTLASNGGTIRNYEVHLRHKDGHAVWVAVSSRYWHDEQGRIQGVEGIAREISDIKEAAEHLLKAKNEYQSLVEFLRAILDRVPAGMVVLNENLEVEVVNNELRRLTGAPSQGELEIIGKPLATIPSVKRLGNLQSLDDLKLGVSFHLRVPFVSIFAKEAVLDVKGVPLISDGVFKGAVLVAADVSEQERVQTELRRALEMSEEIGRAKTALLANVSHELRTPLNGILGAAHLLMSSTLSDTDQKYVNLLYRSAETLLVLVNQILDLSKIEAGKMEQSKKSVDLRQMLVSELDLLAIQAQQKGLILHINVSEMVPGLVELDMAWLRSILLNLVGNAVKFTEHGEVAITVEIEPLEALSMLHFTVADTGIGIADDQLTRIFDSFTQADISLTRRYGGTGLGTTIAKELVSRMGGKIWVESRLGAGSKFHFTVPLSERLEGLAHTRSYYHEELPEPIKRCGYNMNLLLVEDNQINQLVLTDLLTRQGHQVRVARDGAEALRILSDQSFDAILMDIQMPDMDGMQVTRELRARGILTPVIAMTAHAMSGERAACLLAGMNDFVVKPVDLALLDEILSRYARREQAQLEAV